MGSQQPSLDSQIPHICNNVYPELGIWNFSKYGCKYWHEPINSSRRVPREVQQCCYRKRTTVFWEWIAPLHQRQSQMTLIEKELIWNSSGCVLFCGITLTLSKKLWTISRMADRYQFHNHLSLTAHSHWRLVKDVYTSDDSIKGRMT